MRHAYRPSAALGLLAACSLLLLACPQKKDFLRVQLASPHERLPSPRFTVFDPNNPLSPRHDIVAVTDFTDYPEHYPIVWHTVCQRESCAGGDAAVFGYGETLAGFTETVPPRPLQVGRKYALGVDRMGSPGASGRLRFGVEADGSLREYRVKSDGSWEPVEAQEK